MLRCAQDTVSVVTRAQIQQYDVVCTIIHAYMIECGHYLDAFFYMLHLVVVTRNNFYFKLKIQQDIVNKGIIIF